MSTNQFELIFAYSVRQRPNFILLHVSIQLPQYDLLKTHLSYFNYPGALVKKQLTIYVRVYLHTQTRKIKLETFNPIPWISILMPAPTLS